MTLTFDYFFIFLLLLKAKVSALYWQGRVVGGGIVTFCKWSPNSPPSRWSGTSFVL